MWRHPDPDEHLKWMGTIGKWPEGVRDLGQEYAGNTCYRIKQAHVWIQHYYWDISVDNPTQLWVDCLQGNDSIFPGGMLRKRSTTELKHCDCGKWMPPTKEQAQLAEEQYQEALSQAQRARALTKARRVLH